MQPDSANTQVTLAIVNARVWTGDPRKPWADAVAARGSTITAVGSSAEIRKLAGRGADVIDARGQFVAPGFIDSHVHFLQGGLALASVALRDARAPAEFVAQVAAFAATLPAGRWIERGDWDHERWGGELPTRSWIDAVTPHNPVWINRLDGHMALANSAALAVAGITRETPDVAGGTIVRDERGEPTGLFKDNAMPLVQRAVPVPTDAAWDAALDAASQHVLSHGVTSVHNMGTWEELAVFQRAHRAGRLATRVYAAVPLAGWQHLQQELAAHGAGDAWLRIGALKAFVDGSLGSHTAAMLEPYSDAPHDTGLFVNTPDDLYHWTRSADEAGLQVVVHAIGDRAVRTQLDIFERVAREHGARDRRFRIEHAQHVHPSDLPRFGALGVIASMQPYHAIDDGRWAEKVIGPERSKQAFAFQSLLQHGAPLAFGSDWFVAPPVPLLGLYAAVTRRTLDGGHPGGWIPEEKITVEDALRAYTMGAARAGFQERELGSLTVGKRADFVVIDRDITRIDPVELREARVQMTIMDGGVVYDRAGAL